MHFTRIVSVVSAVLATSCLFASATPVDNGIAKRDTVADVTVIVTTLQSTTQGITAQIDALVATGNPISEDDATPLIALLTAAFTEASASLALVDPLGTLTKRQTDLSGIATIVGTIITDVANSLEGLVGQLAGVPDIGVLFTGLDAALQQVLNGLEVLLQGVLNLVATLLVNVAALLRNLAMGLTLSTLGL